MWTEIAKFLDGKSLIMLSATCKWFHRIVMEESIWKYACLRDLYVPDPGKVAFKWIKLYGTAFGIYPSDDLVIICCNLCLSIKPRRISIADGSHSFMFRQKEKHLDRMRIGAFSFNSTSALLTENLVAPFKIPKMETVEEMLQMEGCCVLSNIKSGIWIADLQLARCPVCDLNTCDGTMQILDARHIELFLYEEFKTGEWDYELLGTFEIKKRSEAASGVIFDLMHFKDHSTSVGLNLKTWIGKPNDYQPKAMITLHSVAINTNLQENEGIQVNYHAMRTGKDGEVVSIRISQQLL
ncbi:hypothetical protein LIER_16883 [Lithospermum erythrorhizon]|uniref:F-box domain-containing protein n=1 Tax=Lithospermum erythrorhizon TaxID=34254 RepID=A0AAV3Q8M2_LITER